MLSVTGLNCLPASTENPSDHLSGHHHFKDGNSQGPGGDHSSEVADSFSWAQFAFPSSETPKAGFSPSLKNHCLQVTQETPNRRKGTQRLKSKWFHLPPALPHCLIHTQVMSSLTSRCPELYHKLIPLLHHSLVSILIGDKHHEALGCLITDFRQTSQMGFSLLQNKQTDTSF